MQNPALSVTTLYDWNILVLPTDEEIFVGLVRQQPETLPPFLQPEEGEELLPYMLNNSSAIKEFDKLRGVGFTEAGERYVVIGQPSDPTGMIRLSVSQMMSADEIRWKYDFAE
jgi:hypothetical protein